jgi:hypothetical protein
MMENVYNIISRGAVQIRSRLMILVIVIGRQGRRKDRMRAGVGEYEGAWGAGECGMKRCT